MKECSLIRELLPLFAENLLSDETAEYIENHIAYCEGCARDWQSFTLPLPDPIPPYKMANERDAEKRLLNRMRKTLTAAVLLLVMAGTGLTYASYIAGKHVAMSDPDYRFARELGLFTEINQTRTIDGLRVTMDKGLFDGTRSVLFIHLSNTTKTMPLAHLADQNGRRYQAKGAKGWQNKYFMMEFEPIGLDAQQVTVSVALDQKEKTRTEFTFPVDMVKTVQHTRIVYPNLKKELSNLRITLEKAVLGISESEFEVYFDWPVDGSVAGLGLGSDSAWFPTSAAKVPDTPPPTGMGAPPPGGLMSGYAANYRINYRPGDPPTDRPALYDLTARQEVEAQTGEYATTQFPCQVVATFKFAPAKRETESLELLLPPVYLYEKVEDTSVLHLNFGEQDEPNPEGYFSFPDGKVIIEKVWLEGNQLHLSYKMEPSARPGAVLPHFELADTKDTKQGRMRLDPDKPQIATFSLFSEGTREFCLRLDSLGRLLPREKFTLDLGE